MGLFLDILLRYALEKKVKTMSILFSIKIFFCVFILVNFCLDRNPGEPRELHPGGTGRAML